MPALSKCRGHFFRLPRQSRFANYHRSPSTVTVPPNSSIPICTPLLLVAALTACAPGSEPDAPSPSAADGKQATPATAGTSGSHTATPATPALAVEAEGLRLFDPATGSARAISFGTAQAQTLAALAFRGPPGTGTNQECGAGPLAYASGPDGLQLWFQDDAFAGWALDGRTEGAITTAAGIGPGSTRADLDSAYTATVAQSTLGTEFSAGELFGLLNGAGQGAKVTNMWAGVSCNFR